MSMIIAKKNVFLIVLLGMNSFFCMHGMEKIWIWTLNKGIEEEEDNFTKYIVECAAKVDNADDSMSDNEKLENLIGDRYFEKRKKIIQSMIKYKNIHPDYIIYQNTYPLYEAMVHDDTDFIAYLLRNGARPQPRDLELTVSNYIYKDVQKNDRLRKLFLEYNIVFYKKNKQNDILPSIYDRR